jgi:hypothetical protein
LKENLYCIVWLQELSTQDDQKREGEATEGQRRRNQEKTQFNIFRILPSGWEKLTVWNGARYTNLSKMVTSQTNMNLMLMTWLTLRSHVSIG